ncbi:hypothetical protein K1X76_12840 [bacterium]|nr:hypothetical protein [bacterium]
MGNETNVCTNPPQGYEYVEAVAYDLNADGQNDVRVTLTDALIKSQLPSAMLNEVIKPAGCSGFYLSNNAYTLLYRNLTPPPFSSRDLDADILEQVETFSLEPPRLMTDNEKNSFVGPSTPLDNTEIALIRFAAGDSTDLNESLFREAPIPAPLSAYSTDESNSGKRYFFSRTLSDDQYNNIIKGLSSFIVEDAPAHIRARISMLMADIQGLKNAANDLRSGGTVPLNFNTLPQDLLNHYTVSNTSPDGLVERGQEQFQIRLTPQEAGFINHIAGPVLLYRDMDSQANPNEPQIYYVSDFWYGNTEIWHDIAEAFRRIETHYRASGSAISLITRAGSLAREAERLTAYHQANDTFHKLLDSTVGGVGFGLGMGAVSAPFTLPHIINGFKKFCDYLRRNPPRGPGASSNSGTGSSTAAGAASSAPSLAMMIGGGTFMVLAGILVFVPFDGPLGEGAAATAGLGMLGVSAY